MLPLVVGEQFVGRAEMPVDSLLLIALDCHYWARIGATLGTLFPISRNISLGLVTLASLAKV